MINFVVRRILISFIILFMMTIFVFLLVHMIPGDPVAAMLGSQADQEQIEMYRQQLFLDRPIYEQYVHWLTNAIQGDFGKSIIYGENPFNLIKIRLPITLSLCMISMVFSTFLGIFFGVICAIRRGTVIDSVITVLANLGVTVPIFWVGILAIYFISLQLGWLPIQGYTSPFENFGQSVRQSIMPIFCLALPGIALITRQTRSSMLEVVRQDYIRTAYSKGLNEFIVINKHALKNALIPVVTLLSLYLRVLIGAAVLIERVFNIPGIGSLIVSSVLAKDFIVVQACTLTLAILVMVANLLVDISYGFLDPRIHYD